MFPQLLFLFTAEAEVRGRTNFKAGRFDGLIATLTDSEGTRLNLF
jgi:hypothetical protein